MEINENAQLLLHPQKSIYEKYSYDVEKFFLGTTIVIYKVYSSYLLYFLVLFYVQFNIFSILPYGHKYLHCFESTEFFGVQINRLYNCPDK